MLVRFLIPQGARRRTVDRGPDGQEVRSVLLTVEEGLSGNDVTRFSRYLASTTRSNVG